MRRDTRQKIDPKRRKRDDFVITFLAGPGKSGARYARLYADENNVLAENVVELAKVPRAVAKGSDIQAVVVVDDFVGSGKSASTELKELGPEWLETRPKLVYIALAGFVAGKQVIEATAEDIGVDLTVHLCDPLDESDRLFSASSSAFQDTSEREKARVLASAVGERLVRRHPLGYGDSEAAVVFDEGCPNNSLPVLWEKSREWTPLFPRYNPMR